MLRSLKNPHIGASIRAFTFTTTSSPSISIAKGAGDLTSYSRSNTGQGTFTFAKPAIRPGITLVQSYTDIADGGFGTYDTEPTTSVIKPSLVNASATRDDGSGFVLNLDYTNEYTDRTGSQLQAVLGTGRSGRLMGFKISSAGAAAVGGTQSSSVSKTSSVYTTTFSRAFGQNCMVWCMPIAAAQKACAVTSVSASACSVKTFNASEAAEDNSFYMLVYGWDATGDQWGMRKAIQVPQIKPRLECYRVASNALTLGSTDGTLVRNGTGDYSLTFNKSFAREPIVIGTSISTRVQCLSAATTTGVNIGSFGATGSATDNDFHLLVLGFDSADEK